MVDSCVAVFLMTAMQSKDRLLLCFWLHLWCTAVLPYSWWQQCILRTDCYCVSNYICGVQLCCRIPDDSYAVLGQTVTVFLITSVVYSCVAVFLMTAMQSEDRLLLCFWLHLWCTAVLPYSWWQLCILRTDCYCVSNYICGVQLCCRIPDDSYAV